MDELRTALELATDDELRDLTEILFRRKFNPLDYVNTPDPIEVQSQEREDWIKAIEQRFRFLAADGVTVLSRRTGQLSYRQILIQVCRYLKLPYRSSMSTTDLEAEVFLNLLARAWKQLPASEQGALRVRLQRSLTHSQILPQLPSALQQDPLSLLVKGSSALAVTSVLRPILLQHIARQFAIQFASYQAAQQAIALGGTVAANQFQHYVALQMARRGMAVSAARYAMVRGFFAVLGPALWVWFFADLGWRAIATNYGRIIPIIYALAQIRMTRSECFEPAY
ncbi:YaaW family protein [Leptothermofonsia sp. ETS-13]|uniref:YaaW family protein n=1 Tax=Leptothermofonsia sp. ETS-13 TaxID=3035696 RepID=UPI003BA3410F